MHLSIVLDPRADVLHAENAAEMAALRKKVFPFGSAANRLRLTPRTNWSVTHRT